MKDKLNSSREVEELIGNLGCERYPAANTENLTGLVWERLEHPIAPVFIAFRPAFAIVLIMGFLGVTLWSLGRMGSFPFAVKPSLKVIPAEIEVHGIVVGQTGKTSGVQKLEIRTGDIVTTDENSSLTIYLPAAGYLYLPGDTRFLIEKAVQSTETGLMNYQITLNQGAIYARLPEFERGSFLTARTQTGQIRVTGTDFLLGVNKDGSTTVSVLAGSVETEANSRPDLSTPVKKGSRALILPDLDGTLLISELNPEEQIKLKTDFERIFEDMVAYEKAVQKKAKERNIQILWRQDE